MCACDRPRFSLPFLFQILVHGDASEGCGRLRYALESRYTDGSVRIIAPRNLQTVELQFRAQKVAKTVGALAAMPPADGTKLSGLIVRKNFVDYTLMREEELSHFTALSSTTVEQSIKVPFHQTFASMKYFVGQMYDLDDEDESETAVDNTDSAGAGAGQTITVHSSVHLTYHLTPSTHVIIRWKSNPVNDMLSDSLIAILTNIQSNPGMAKVIGSAGECRNASVTGHTHKHTHSHSTPLPVTAASPATDPFEAVKPAPPSAPSSSPSFRWFLEQHYGSDISFDAASDTYSFTLNTIPCTVDMRTLAVGCADEQLRKRIAMMVRRAHVATQPINRINSTMQIAEVNDDETHADANKKEPTSAAPESTTKTNTDATENRG